MTVPLRLALGLLTRLPVSFSSAPTPSQIGTSVLFYPLVGLLIGGLLHLAALALEGVATPGLSAALLLALWVWITGGLHLDGLADTADAWVGGMGDRQRTLDIMKDPHAGPAAVTAMVVTLIVKVFALESLLSLQAGGEWLLLWPPLIARFGLVLLFFTTPYAKPHGMGRQAWEQMPRGWAGALLLAVGAGLLLLVILPFLVLLLWTLLFRRALMARLGGFTGDTAGAFCELAETILVVTVVLYT